MLKCEKIYKKWGSTVQTYSLKKKKRQTKQKKQQKKVGGDFKGLG